MLLSGENENNLTVVFKLKKKKKIWKLNWGKKQPHSTNSGTNLLFTFQGFCWIRTTIVLTRQYFSCLFEVLNEISSNSMALASCTVTKAKFWSQRNICNSFFKELSFSTKTQRMYLTSTKYIFLHIRRPLNLTNEPPPPNYGVVW